jgi:radical SAM protein with 4Fe4S-binding SPASM domain
MELAAPLHVHWEITNTCNLHCLHCYQQADSARSQLAESDLYKIAENIVKSRVFQVTVTGGEPFAVPSLQGIVEYFHRNQISPIITSNGTLINRNACEWLARLGLRVQISLDSHDLTIHNKIRRDNQAFQRACAGIKLLREQKIGVSISFCANRQNFRGVQNLIMLAMEVGADSIIVGEILPLFGRPEDLRTLVFTQAEYAEYISSVVLLKERFKRDIHVEISSERGFLFDNNIEHAACTALDRDLAILHDGYAYPCPFIRSQPFRLGSAVTTDLVRLWKSDVARNFRSGKHEGCTSDCRFFSKCLSGCKASLANQGLPISRPDPNCPLAVLTNK